MRSSLTNVTAGPERSNQSSYGRDGAGIFIVINGIECSRYYVKEIGSSHLSFIHGANVNGRPMYAVYQNDI